MMWYVPGSPGSSWDEYGEAYEAKEADDVQWSITSMDGHTSSALHYDRSLANALMGSDGV